MASPAAEPTTLSLALVDAARDGESERLASLLEAAADPNVQTARTMQTPLFMACVHGQEEVAMQLMAAHADVEITNNSGISPLMAAATYGHVSCLERLLEAGADVHRADRFGRTALFSACSAGHPGPLTVLLPGAPPSIFPPFHYDTLPPSPDCLIFPQSLCRPKQQIFSFYAPALCSQLARG